MIDFSTLKGLTIPEGNVSKIEDAQGNVLWSAVPKMCTVALNILGTTVNMFNSGMATVSINGITVATPLEAQSTYLLNVGDSMVFTTNNLANIPIMVDINGEVVQSNNPILKQYTYSVKSNATIDAMSSGGLRLAITET